MEMAGGVEADDSDTYEMETAPCEMMTGHV
jgi:hypothetical protein